ncbi:MAG TPA: hypothetical protein PKK95_08365 [Vicinamibacterales bacterium]|mgnify:FL=1|nr:hypothetical protein [Vicinamibacterales bacterium]
MSKGARLLEVIYVDTEEPVNVLIGLGDSIRAAEWAEAEYPYPAKPDLPADLSPAEVDFRIAEYRRERLDVDAKREWRSGLYAVFLAAQRAKLRGSELGWLEWLSLVTIPQDDEPAPAEEPSAGESDAPQSAS